MVKRLCLAGCGALTTGTYCPRHDTRRSEDRHRLSQRQRGYATAEYRRNRRLVLERDGCCVYCGAPADTVDHVVPYARSQDNSLDNLVAACRSCNSRKGDRSPVA